MLAPREEELVEGEEAGGGKLQGMLVRLERRPDRMVGAGLPAKLHVRAQDAGDRVAASELGKTDEPREDDLQGHRR